MFDFDYKIKTSKILEGIIIRNRHKIFRGMNEYSEDDSPYVAAIDLAKELTGKNLTILKIVLLIIVFCWVVNCCLNSQLQKVLHYRYGQLNGW